MGRKTISLSSSNVSAPNKSVTSNSSSVSSNSKQVKSGTTRATRKSLTPDIPLVPSELSQQSSSSSSTLSSASSSLAGETSKPQPPVKRPRSAGGTAAAAKSEPFKKQRALLSTSALNEAATASTSASRKRPSSSNSDFVTEKQLKTEVLEPDSADTEESSSKSYWLRSKSSSSMKRVSNETGNVSRTSKQQANEKQAIPLQTAGNEQSNCEQQKKPSQKASAGATSGSLLTSLVSSTGAGVSSTTSRSSKQSTSTSNKTSSRTQNSSTGVTNAAKTQSQMPAGRKGHGGTKLLSSSSGTSSNAQQKGTVVSSPREATGRHGSGSNRHNAAASSSSNQPNLSEVAASFASAAAAMNAISPSSGSSIGSGSGIPTLPPGASGGEPGGSSGTGAANLLRQFGKFLSRGASSSGPTSARAMSLINQLQSAAFDTEQLQCLQDLCDIINMNTEDTLQEFPTRQAALVLTELMSGASGFEVAISACRALTYMLDCVPHAAKFVTMDTVRCLISKLNDIECIDIAEQALSALEFLSASHHSKSILRAGGVAACLQFIDFFSTLCQQKSLTIVANCCIGITPTEYAQIRDSIDRLAQQLLNQDRKCVELVSLAFSYITSGCERDESVIREVASHGFLINTQQVLLQTPPVVGPAVYCQIFNTLSTICGHCPDQSVQLLLQNFPSTLAFLLTGNREALNYNNEQPIVLLSSGITPGGICSGSQELAEIVTLISELLPPPPDEELFNTFPVVATVPTPSSNPLSTASQYMAAFLGSPFEWTENPFSFLASHGDDNEDMDPTAQALLAMQSAVMGRNNPASSSQSQQPTSSQTQKAKTSVLSELYTEKPELFHGLVANMTGPLLDICQTTTAGTIELKAKCLETLQRLLLVAPDTVLSAMIRAPDLSSCLAQFLTAQNPGDLRVAGLALQICHLLLRRCPELFASQAVKQGISHQIAQTLAYVTSAETNSVRNSEESSGGSLPSRPGSGDFQEPDAAGDSEEQSGVTRRTHSRNSGNSKTSQKTQKATAKESPSTSTKAVRSSSRGSNKADVPAASSSLPVPPPGSEEDSSVTSGFRKLRSTVKSVLGRGKGSAGSQQPPPPQPSASQPSTSRSSVGQGPSRKSRDGSPLLLGSSGSRSRNSNNSRSGTSQQLQGRQGHPPLQSQLSESQNQFQAQMRTWIAQWAKSFLEKLDEVVRRCEEEKNSQHHSTAVAFAALKSAASSLNDDSSNFQQSLVEIRDLIMTQDFSLFELGSSGLTDSLVKFLSSAPADHLRTFLRLFAILPPGLETKHEDVRSPESFQRQPMAELVSKLVGCLQQIEQFEVKSATVRDRTPTGIFSSTGGIMPSSLLAAAMTTSGGANSGAAAFSVSPVVRFFSSCSLKLELRRSQPQQQGN